MHHLPPICMVFFRICFQGHKPRWAHISCGPGKGLRSRRYAEESTGELTVGSLFAGKETLRVVFEIPSTTQSQLFYFSVCFHQLGCINISLQSSWELESFRPNRCTSTSVSGKWFRSFHFMPSFLYTGQAPRRRHSDPSIQNYRQHWMCNVWHDRWDETSDAVSELVQRKSFMLNTHGAG